MADRRLVAVQKGTDAQKDLVTDDEGKLYVASTSTANTLRYVEGVTYTYIGEAAPGTPESDNSWRIKRLTNANNTIVWADGDATFSKVWDDYISYSYQ